MPEIGPFSPNNPIILESVVGEKASIRPVNRFDETDLNRMHDIEHNEKTIKWVYGPDAELFNNDGIAAWIHGFEQNPETKRVFAISSADSSLPIDQKGEIQGWIRLDSSPSEKQRVENSLGYPLATDDTNPVEPQLGYAIEASKFAPTEITYVRHPNAPTGLVASAVRETCRHIFEEDAQNDTKISPTRMICAYVKPENEDSVRVLEKSAFKKVRDNVIWHIDDPEKAKTNRYDFYILDVKEYLKISQEKALNEVKQLLGNQNMENVSLPEQTSPTFQDKVVGEKAALGNDFPFDSDTESRHKEIDVMLSSDGHVEGNVSMTKEELIDWLTPRENHRVYSVTGSTVLENVQEVGKLQGWVAVDSSNDESERAQRGIDAPLPENTQVFEVAYAKYPNAEGGQIASALRQTCMSILRMNPNLIEPVIDKDTLGREIVTGYKIKSIVTAFTDPDNLPSESVLEHAGFVKQPKDVWWKPEDQTDPNAEINHFWVLDWNILLEQSVEKAKPEFARQYNNDQPLPKSTLSTVMPQFEGQVMSPKSPPSP